MNDLFETLSAHLSISAPVLITSLVAAIVIGVLIVTGLAARIVGFLQEFSE